MEKNIKTTGSTIENQNAENVSIYMNDYFPGMALSWYWDLTIVCRSMGNTFYKQIMMTNTDIDIGGIVNHYYLNFLFITIYGWFRVQKMCQNGATHLSTI